MSLVETDHIPLRALNQAGYCSRLFYLEYVEAVMPINEHVEEGTFLHRRVNDPDLENRKRKVGDHFETRSLSLSSETLGLTGKLDVLEETDDTLTPVEYKRSAAPIDENGEPTYYLNDALQLCGQALLLEEHTGKTISNGVLYYIGSKTRVDVPIGVILRSETLQMIETIRELSGLSQPPEPLGEDLRHRCVGCSLATICLPEETLLLRETESHPRPAPTAPDPSPEPPSALRRVLPAADDRAVLYVQDQGAFVGKRSQHLVVSVQGEQKQRVPIASVRQVVVFGNVQVSTQALETLAANEIPVVYLTAYGKFIAALEPAPAKNVFLRSSQYRMFNDPETALELARAVVAAKIANQRTLLMRSLRTRSAADEDDNSPIRGSDEPAASGMQEMLARVHESTSANELLGLEGQAAALYFGQFGRMLKKTGPGRPFDFNVRNRRPPRDPVNALLSFAYAILLKDCFSAACTVGFDPYQGFYHAGRHGKPSLALDLMEEFRAIIADSVVLTLINNAILSETDFLISRDACQLSEAGRKKFFQAYETRKATEVTHPTFGYKMSYGRMIEVQMRVLAARVKGELHSYQGFTVR